MPDEPRAVETLAWGGDRRGRPRRSPAAPAVVLAAVVLIGVAAIVARPAASVPDVVTDLDREGSSVDFGGERPVITADLTAVGDSAGPGAVPLRPVMLSGPGLRAVGADRPGAAADGTTVEVDCRIAVEPGAAAQRRLVVESPTGRRTEVGLGSAAESWAGLLATACWQQSLRTEVTADLLVPRAPSSRRVPVTLVIANGTAGRLGLVLALPPGRGVLLRPDGVPDGAEEERTTWVEPGSIARLPRVMLVPCAATGEPVATTMRLRFRREAAPEARWDAPEPPIRGVGSVSLPIPADSAAALARAVDLAARSGPRAAFCP